MSSFILGGGMTGLSAGMVSGLPVFEAANIPGGICSSYYMRPGETERLPKLPQDGEAYHFEIGGGHWIFGGDPAILRFIQTLTPIQKYYRRSSVYLSSQNLYIPYPLQNHLRYLDPQTASQALAEIAQPQGPFCTMAEWLRESFGSTLCNLFFYPFHDLYTAGLYQQIAPQDAYKSPVNLQNVIQGVLQEADAVGYNVTFVYPQLGLNVLAQRMANCCDVRYGKRVVKIDVNRKMLYFEDATTESYTTLISTLPLNQMLAITNLSTDDIPDPYTSVLVLNIGAERGKSCPDDHWLYNVHTTSGFHRVGFYSNVDRLFLPQSAQAEGKKISVYVERAFKGGAKPDEPAILAYSNAVIQELQSWGFMDKVEVVDPTWIDVAYTWSLPGSQWRQKALQLLEKHQIYQIGRYGRWVFQGIANSIKDGFFVGASFKNYG